MEYSEHEICEMVKNGKSMTQVARKLGLHNNTIKRICDRYGVKSKYKFGGNRKIHIRKKKSFWEKFWMGS